MRIHSDEDDSSPRDAKGAELTQHEACSPALQSVAVAQSPPPTDSSPPADCAIVYTAMKPEHVSQVVEILAQAFTKEPSTSHCKWGEEFTTNHWRRFIRLYIDESLKREMTVVALDADTGCVAGAFMADDFLTPEPDGMYEIIRGTQMEPEMHAVHLIDEAFFKAHPQIDRHQPGLVCDLWLLGVDSRYTGKGIAKGLCSALTDVIRKKGYRYGVMECTGHYSQSMARRCGYTGVYALPYNDFVWRGERVYLNAVPEPHKCWEIFVKDLQDEGNKVTASGEIKVSDLMESKEATVRCVAVDTTKGNSSVDTFTHNRGASRITAPVRSLALGGGSRLDTSNAVDRVMSCMERSNVGRDSSGKRKESSSSSSDDEEEEESLPSIRKPPLHHHMKQLRMEHAMNRKGVYIRESKKEN
eukprot:CAMPEP_0117447380 /NCGR_PEP_ID=MMETSP0759-20121206/6845_1 /TAXON_ID=63605 /ORGANISM="Percolomonas cosmopolitus, Strain WS" /LENGTH=413 /DNA_ID=CAMNT_0005239713 /DNA_START=383 /DNA_END=1624 /DNA_ORIENTATION=-